MQKQPQVLCENLFLWNPIKGTQQKQQQLNWVIWVLVTESDPGVSWLAFLYNRPQQVSCPTPKHGSTQQHCTSRGRGEEQTDGGLPAVSQSAPEEV